MTPPRTHKLIVSALGAGITVAVVWMGHLVKRAAEADVSRGMDMREPPVRFEE